MKQEPFEAGTYYHIFNRGNNKENIFKEEGNYTYFLQLTKKYLKETCNIYAYCLLPNHFHLLLKIKENEQLPIDFQNGKKKLHQAFSNLFNDRENFIYCHNSKKVNLELLKEIDEMD